MPETLHEYGDASENAMVELARDNDYRAYEQLYQQHAGRVYALCVRLCHDRDMAEDLTQESFVLAWRKLGSFRGDSAFGTWLYRITTNTVLSYLRKHKAFINSLDIDALPEAGRGDGVLEQLSLEQAIGRLPAGYCRGQQQGAAAPCSTIAAGFFAGALNPSDRCCVKSTSKTTSVRIKQYR